MNGLFRLLLVGALSGPGLRVTSPTHLLIDFTEMDVMIWETQSSEPFQVANVVTKSGTGENCRTIYCPATKQSGPRLLCYGFNNQELVIWKWWN